MAAYSLLYHLAHRESTQHKEHKKEKGAASVLKEASEKALVSTRAATTAAASSAERDHTSATKQSTQGTRQWLFPPGLVEEILAKTMRDDASAMRRWTSLQRREYEKWRDSFGLHRPDPSVVGGDNVLASSFCGAISCQEFTREPQTLSSVLDLIFKEVLKQGFVILLRQDLYPLEL